MEDQNNSEDSLHEEVKDVVENLEDTSRLEEISKVRREDPMLGMRNALIDFIESRLQVVNEEENFRSAIKEAILAKIQNGEASLNQLSGLLKTVDSDTTNAAESILSLLRPNQSGEVSPIFSQNKAGSESEDTHEFDNLDPQQAEVLHKLSRLVQHIETQEDSSNTSDK